MRFTLRSLLGLAHLTAALAFLALAAHLLTSALDERSAGSGGGAPATERAVTVTVVTVQPATLSPRLAAFGEVQSRRTLELRAASEGTVVELHPRFAEGGAVAAGEVILRLDARDAEAARDLAAADLEAARMERAEAERALDLARDDLAAAEAQAELRDKALVRLEDLAGRGLGTEADREAAALAASSAAQGVLTRRQALAEAEARLNRAATSQTRTAIAREEANRRLADTVIRAAFDGVLTGVTATQGTLVGRNESLGRLIDPDALEVGFRLSVTDFARLVTPDGALLPLAAEVSAQGQAGRIGARLERAGASLAAGEAGRLVYAALDAPGPLRPGDFVSVTVEEPALSGAAELPATAIGPDGTVLSPGPDGRLEALTPAVLRRQGDTVVIDAGTLAGRQVVTARAAHLSPGVLVQPVVAGPDAAAAQHPAGG